MQKATAVVNGYLFLEGIKNFYQRMREEFAILGIDLSLRTTTDLLSCINEDGEISLKDDLGSFVLFLDKDKYLSTILEKKGIKLFNNAEAIRLCDDKMITGIALANCGIKMPKTIGSPLNCFDAKNEKFVDSVEKAFGYPLIAKCAFGSMGSGVFLINKREELDAFVDEHKNEATLFQEFIKTSRGVDYRVIVIGGKAIGAMKRQNPNDFRSNIALGGTAEPVELEDPFLNTAETASKILNLDYCGVDLLIGPNNEPILCEVNSNAFIKGFEYYTGINVAKKYAEYIVTKIK